MSFEERLALIRRGPDECWLWLWAKTPRGYGHFRRDTLDVYAHRAAYELLVGPIPKRAQIDHTCEVTSCCNPAHMEPVTSPVHNQRTRSRPTHCRNGHLRSQHGWKVFPNGTRLCQACYRSWYTARRLRQTGQPVPPSRQLLAVGDRRRTHCYHGHDRAVAGWKIFPNGHRQCRACYDAKNARRVQRRAAARTA